ncbi:MAG: protein-glutamate O-methyltransferase CheR [Lachnospiraceae bacterium]|nr:protein-glutamate O-methyltransferase CheR [Lachnospiraceae bacterium]
MYNDYESFKKDIYLLTSINLDKYKERQMKRRIDTLIAKNRITTYSDYVELLKGNKKYLDEFINYLTINVSEFFRNKEQWDILANDVIPYLKKNNRGKIKIWSAACSTGEEPYSVAMLFLEHFSKDKFSIYATDIDKNVLNKAKEGLYISRVIESVPKKYVDKHFHRKENGMYIVDDAIKKQVTFAQHDLLKDPYPQGFDLIICRNVVIYFTDNAKEDIFKRFNEALVKNGILFVGNTEQIIHCSAMGYSTFNSFFYKKTN